VIQLPVVMRCQCIQENRVPETAFTYADLHGRPDTPQQRTSRGVQAQEADHKDREVYVRARAGKTDK